MNRFLNALSSSVGKKFVMGFTGLLLCGFLVVHLAGNLLMYAGAQPYNDYAHALHSHVAFLRTIEVALYALFLAHIFLAFCTAQENRSARGKRYLLKRSKLGAAPHTTDWPLHPEAWMFTSGAIVLGFLILHLSDFAWEIRLKGAAGEEPFDKAIRILQNNVTAVVYVVGSVILGIHLWHGFASAFQSLGITHPRYAALIKWTGVVFACVMGVGFASFVFFARMGHVASVR